MEEAGALTRRTFLSRTAAGAASATFAGGVIGRAWGAPAAKAAGVVPLPSPARVRADYQRMVDFGPRLPGYVEHDRFCDWLEEQFVRAGLELIPCDEYEYDRWRPRRLGLELLDGASSGTGQGRDLLRAREGHPGRRRRRAAGARRFRRLGRRERPARGPHGDDAGADGYSRLWRGPWPNLQPYADRGAKAVVFVVNTSFDELEGNWSPHTGPFSPSRRWSSTATRDGACASRPPRVPPCA